MSPYTRTLDSIRSADATQTLTLLDLVTAVAESAESEDEVVATVSHLLASGQVRLVGHFREPDLDQPLAQIELVIAEPEDPA